MIETKFLATAVEAALKREGVWLIDLTGAPTSFYHKSCFSLQNRERPERRADLSRFAQQLNADMLRYFNQPWVRANREVMATRERMDFGR